MAKGKQQLEIRLFPDGNIRAETHNIKGKQCLKYMELLEALLNARITDSSFTEEYYQTEEMAETLDEMEVRA